MNMNMFYLLAEESKNTISVCNDLAPVWTILGYIILAIQVIVPILLIISGMITMAQAVMEKKEDKIKEAQNLLIKKIIAAVLCFLVIAITKMVVNLVVTGDWETCVKCALHPTTAEGCGFDKAEVNPK